MITNLLLGLFVLALSSLVEAGSFNERFKVAGFTCDYGKAMIHIRSLDADRALYLAKNSEGVPIPLESTNDFCTGLIKNLSKKFTGQILEAEFFDAEYSKTEIEWRESIRPCGLGRTKCDEEGASVTVENRYRRLETILDGYRFYREDKIKINK